MTGILSEFRRDGFPAHLHGSTEWLASHQARDGQQFITALAIRVGALLRNKKPT
jgi:hypothetical protein